MKKIINKQGFIKIKNFCSLKDNVKKMRQKDTGWEKVFSKDTFNNVLLSKIYKELLKLNKEINNPF